MRLLHHVLNDSASAIVKDNNRKNSIKFAAKFAKHKYNGKKNTKRKSQNSIPFDEVTEKKQKEEGGPKITSIV